MDAASIVLLPDRKNIAVRKAPGSLLNKFAIGRGFGCGRFCRCRFCRRWLAFGDQVIDYAVNIAADVGGHPAGHDRGKSGWWLLVFFAAPAILSSTVAVAGEGLQPVLEAAGAALSVWAFAALACLRGTAGPNAYGDDPLAA